MEKNKTITIGEGQFTLTVFDSEKIPEFANEVPAEIYFRDFTNHNINPQSWRWAKDYWCIILAHPSIEREEIEKLFQLIGGNCIPELGEPIENFKKTEVCDLVIGNPESEIIKKTTVVVDASDNFFLTCSGGTSRQRLCFQIMLGVYLFAGSVGKYLVSMKKYR